MPPGPETARWRRWLGAVEDGLLAVEDGLLVALLGVMIVLAGAQILLRNLWHGGLLWGDPLLRVLVLWLALLGAMAATRDANHITIDLLSRFLPPRVQRLARLATNLFAAAVCTILAWQGVNLVRLDYEARTLAFAGAPAWACELIIPVGFAVMALRFALNVVDGLHASGAR